MENLIEPARTGASLNRGKSKQDYGTPRDFLNAVESRFGSIRCDLAASNENAVCEERLTLADDSLSFDWDVFSGPRPLWLNPPFADIEPWAAKCAKHGSWHTRILFLTPASVGSNWFSKHVHGKAYVLALSPRLTFVGTSDPYPKDLMLSVFCGGPAGFDVWRWKP